MSITQAGYNARVRQISQVQGVALETGKGGAAGVVRRAAPITIHNGDCVTRQHSAVTCLKEDADIG